MEIQEYLKLKVSNKETSITDSDKNSLINDYLSYIISDIKCNLSQLYYHLMLYIVYNNELSINEKIIHKEYISYFSTITKDSIDIITNNDKEIYNLLNIDNIINDEFEIITEYQIIMDNTDILKYIFKSTNINDILNNLIKE